MSPKTFFMGDFVLRVAIYVVSLEIYCPHNFQLVGVIFLKRLDSRPSFVDDIEGVFWTVYTIHPPLPLC